jgi:hypothetical protein
MMADERRRLVQLALLGCVIGLLLSQYQPLFGEAKALIAEPWTPLKKTLAGPHMGIFAGAGVIVGVIRNRLAE